MSTRRLLQSNNGGGRNVQIALATPANRAALGAETFTRADATTCATQRAVDGGLATVLANVLRATHYIGTARTILVESSKKNLCVNPSSPNLWVPGLSSVTVVDNTTDLLDPLGTNTAAKMTVTASFANADQTCAFTGNGTKVIYVCAAHGTAAVSRLALEDLTASTVLANVSITWNGSSAPTVAIIAGTPTIFSPVLLKNGFWVVAIAVGSVVALHTNLLIVDPAGSASSGTMYEWQAQAEDAAFPSSPIIQGAIALTRAVDALSYAGVPITGTLFYHYWDLATQAWVAVAAAYTASTTITPPVDRAYTHIAVLQGTHTAAQCKAILGGTFQ